MPPNEVLNGARTMWELVERRAAASPDRPMLIAADGDLDEKVRRIIDLELDHLSWSGERSGADHAEEAG